MAQNLTLSVFKDSEGGRLVIPNAGKKNNGLISKMTESGYRYVRTLTQEVPDELDIKKFLALVDKHDDDNLNLTRALWGLSTMAYEMGKGRI